MGETYKAAGVDIDAGERAVDLIRPLVASTERAGVIGGIGGFGGLFAIDEARVLVAATDGVGTKLEIARALGVFDTIGIDLVAMCVDDLVCLGAEPLFFLDYIATEQLDPAQIRDVVAGVAEGCRIARCALLGGEMAEHPGTMLPGTFDLAGFAVGVVERNRIIDGSSIAPGDVMVGLRSPGLRSNGYSLARAIVERAGLDLHQPAWNGSVKTLGEELLTPSVIYAPQIHRILERAEVRGIAHITGGGLASNVSRTVRTPRRAAIDTAAWTPPRIFDVLQAQGGVDDAEMRRVFNMGIGMVLVVPDPQPVLDLADAVVIGEVV